MNNGLVKKTKTLETMRRVCQFLRFASLGLRVVPKDWIFGKYCFYVASNQAKLFDFFFLVYVAIACQGLSIN